MRRKTFECCVVYLTQFEQIENIFYEQNSEAWLHLGVTEPKKTSEITKSFENPSNRTVLLFSVASQDFWALCGTPNPLPTTRKHFL